MLGSNCPNYTLFHPFGCGEILQCFSTYLYEIETTFTLYFMEIGDVIFENML